MLRPGAFWIGNEFVAPHGSTTFDVINPATEQHIASVPVADECDVDRAVAAARKCIDDDVQAKEVTR
jgi:aldehyde dehydrogenase (NAD+)